MAMVNTDAVIRQAEYYGAMIEVLQQNTAGFNEASNGAIRLINQQEQGHFYKESFIKQNVHIGRRVTTDITNKTATILTMGDRVSAKLARSYMADTTRDTWRKLAKDISGFSVALGQQVGVEKSLNYLNTVILSGVSAMSSQALILHDAGAAPMDYNVLSDGQAKFGDRRNRIVAWVMHSTPHNQVIRASLASGLDNVAGVTINRGSAATLGLPVVVTDSPALIDGGQFITLGLTEAAFSVLETEGDDVVTDVVTGQGNLINRVQGEHSFNCDIKGYSWLEASGANPDDSALGAAANYAQQVTDHKSLPGVLIKTT